MAAATTKFRSNGTQTHDFFNGCRKPAPAGSLTLLAGCADETYPDHVERVYLQLTPLMRTKDFREGVQSYLEKRPPKFTGN